MTYFFDSLLGNRILMGTILSFCTAQVIKSIIVLIRERRFDLNRLFGAGGMPSSHSALVTTLAVSTGQEMGVGSPEFAIATALAIIVMYDATNVRRAAGEQAKILNAMMSRWGDSTPEFIGRKLKELLGHTPVQVIIGSALGALIAFLY